VLEQSILTRAIGIEAPDRLAKLIDTMPSGVISRDAKSAKTRSALWSLFFSGSMTKLARVASARPFIAFYNPIADIAVIQGCYVAPKTGVLQCTEACAVPGEAFSGESVQASPRWMVSRDPIQSLETIAGARMRAFAATNPASSSDPVSSHVSYCSSRTQRTSEDRLISLAATSQKFDERRFREAAGRYVAQAMGAVTSQRGGSNVTADRVITVLEHLNEMTMSGAIVSANGGWILFLSEKQNGWRMAALNISSGPDGMLKIESAQLLRISTKEQ